MATNKKNPSQYSSEIKNAIRNSVLNNAVHSLTNRQKSSKILVPNFVEGLATSAADFLIEHNIAGKELHSALQTEIDKWKKECSPNVGRVLPEKLKVLLLSGPKPSNDVRVLLDLGVDAKNIVAIECDPKIYQEALKDIHEKNLPIELHKGDLANYFKTTNMKFHIVYFDACGPFMGGKKNTLAPLLEMFVNQRLEDINLTMSLYSHTVLQDRAQALKKIAGVDEPSEQTPLTGDKNCLEE